MCSAYSGKEVGSVFWKAPEVINPTSCEEKIGGRAVDIWSLGITVLEMIFDTPPFMMKYRYPFLYKNTLYKNK